MLFLKYIVNYYILYAKNTFPNETNLLYTLEITL